MVGRGSPDDAEWGPGKGDFGMVKEGLGVPLMDGRGDRAGMADFAGRSASDCLGVEVAEAVLVLTSRECRPSVEPLDFEDAFEKARGRAAVWDRRLRVEGYLPRAPRGRGGSTLS